MTHKTKLILIGLVVLFFCSFNLYGAEYKLKWDAVSGDVTGYKINYGTSVGNYTNTKDVGKVTEYALSNLPLSVGTTYYFVVRAYNATCESEDSDYVTYKVTAVSDTTPPLNPQGATAVIQGDGIRISWQAVTAQDLSGYKVYYGVESRNYSPSVPVGNVTGYSLGGLEKGRKYYVAVTAVDTSENESGFSPETSIEIPAAIDTPPVINIASPVSSGSYTATNATISVSGTATDDKGISQVKWANSLGGIGTAIGTSNWSGSITLKDGTNVVTVTAYDTAGKTAGASIQIIYKTPDSIKPVIALASPTTGAAYSTTNSSVNVTGTATDNVSVSKVTWANSATGINGTATGTSNWSVSNVSLIAGTNAITITASDGASNTGSVTLNVIYSPADTEKPIVKLVSPTTNSSYTQNQTVINLSGTATDNTAVSKVTWANSASGESGIASGTNTWSISNVPLKPGMNAVTITASDISGNMGSVILNVTCNAADTTKPVVKIVLPTTATSYTANQALVNLSGTATDNIGISQVTWLNSTSGQSGTATGTDNWSVGNVSLVSGSNPIIITAYDATGNTGSVTLNVTRNILTTLIDTTDTAKPVITLSSPTTGTSYTANQASINLSGTATDNIGISKVTWSNSSSGQSGTATGTDNWSVGNVSLVSGSNPIIITAYDATGNTGSVTL
ncbi:MAG: fibronectin type III domain-containing protein, partial [Proteobacteria bacterium]|nr:fibronectin type III domain-containing protein [Pseudomonadota bacterium]